MRDSDKQPLNEKGVHDAIINMEETHEDNKDQIQDPVLSVKCSLPILLQLESLLHLQSYSLQSQHTHNTINIGVLRRAYVGRAYLPFLVISIFLIGESNAQVFFISFFACSSEGHCIESRLH
jgi:hypothetical protein